MYKANDYILVLIFTVIFSGTAAATDINQGLNDSNLSSEGSAEGIATNPTDPPSTPVNLILFTILPVKTGWMMEMEDWVKLLETTTTM